MTVGKVGATGERIGGIVERTSVTIGRAVGIAERASAIEAASVATRSKVGAITDHEAIVESGTGVAVRAAEGLDAAVSAAVPAPRELSMVAEPGEVAVRDLEDTEVAGGEVAVAEAVDASLTPRQKGDDPYGILEPIMASDEEVIEAVLGGDVDRYAELLDKYQQPALRLAFSMLGNYEDAKDASQEAFVSAYRALARFRGGAQFSTWLYRIVVNACKDMHRRRARRPMAAAQVGEPGPQTDHAGLFIDVDDPAGDPGEQLANRELGQRLSGAIGALPMKQRTAFVLHHLQGLSLDEVAEVMHCRLGTVKSHLFRATEQLRTQLGPWLAREGV